MKKISIIFGTRPEAIKLAPLILELKKHPKFKCHICVTAQHREMLDQVLKIFEIYPDQDLNLMRPNQSLSGLTARAITGLDEYLLKEKPDMVIVQGDTTTVFAGALAAFYHHIPVAHVEAGLRTGNIQSPWPEEANRVLTSKLVSLHFAPTESSSKNLLHEHINSNSIAITGNTVIDALFIALKKIEKDSPFISDLPDFLQPYKRENDPQLILITGHRRENFGKGFEHICNAISILANKFPNIHFVYPMHLNPNVREPVKRILKVVHDPSTPSKSNKNIHLIEPLEYLPFVAMMNRASIILTDSGGVQEEAPSLGKPVLVMRDTTERPEAIDAGTVKLVGTNQNKIINQVSLLLENKANYEKMAKAHNPYGDGHATARHIKALEDYFLV